MKRNLTLLLTLAMLAVGCGKTTLQKGGVYADKEVLYNADKTIVNAYSLMDTFVAWEFQNRAVLPADVTKIADRVRTEAKAYIKSAIALRDAYAIAPTEETKTKLETTLTIIRQLMVEVTTHMTKGINP